MAAGPSPGFAGVRFEFISGAAAKKNSLGAVTNYELFTPSGAPISGGPYDLKLGTTEHSHQCLTCANGKKLCPGHRGHHDLRVPLVHPITISEVRHWLRVACHVCGSLVVEMDKLAAQPAPRRLAAAAASDTAGRPCPQCRALHPKIVKDEDDNFTFRTEPAEGGEKSKRGRPSESRGKTLSPMNLLTIFERIRDEDVLKMGRSLNVHPRNFIQWTIPISPGPTRPSVHSSAGARSSHDITGVLQHIVRRTNQMPITDPTTLAQIPMNVKDDIGRSWANQQQLYFDLIIGSSASAAQKGNSGKRAIVAGTRSLSSIMRNLPGKSGRLRGALLGKRAHDTARSTISGDSQLPIDVVCIPMVFARTLQVEETVQEGNRDWLMTFFLNGRRQYPGCTYVVRRVTGEVHDVAGLRDVRLEVGDVLFRDMIDGDLVFFNRQPTLEFSSIGVHRIVVNRDPTCHTLRMNVLACPFYNADFDGDQMMVIPAKKKGCVAEASITSPVALNFANAKDGNVIGQQQDSLFGCHQMTRASVAMSKFQAMALFSGSGMEPPRFDELPPDHIYTNKDIVRLLLQGTSISLKCTPSSYSDVFAAYMHFDPRETATVIEQGELISGVLDKKTIGPGARGGVYDLIYRRHGAQRALDAMFSTQQVALHYLIRSGFTVSIGDIMLPADIRKRIREVIAGVHLESGIIAEMLTRGEIVPPIGDTVGSFYERLQLSALRTPEAEVLRLLFSWIKTDTNGFFKMIQLGSKGSLPNLFNVMTMIAQIIVNDGRTPANFAFGRTMGNFPRFCEDPAAHGYVSNCYVTGMTSSEFIFAMQAGRFDLVNKALSTAVTGAKAREMVMASQSNIVDPRNAVTMGNRIVQFIYGGDGLDPRHLEKVAFPTVTMSDAELLAFTTPERLEEISAARASVDEAVQRIRADRDSFRSVSIRTAAATFGRSFNPVVFSPVNVRNIVDSVFIAQKVSGKKDTAPLTADGLVSKIERVWDLCARLPYTFINEIQERRRTALLPHITSAAELVCMFVRAELNPRILVSLSDEQLDYIFDSIRLRYRLSLMNYGTAVGILASQAISEPLTQYMLDSHHRSVAGGTSKSGIVRVSEIYGARGVDEEKSSTMLLPLKPGFGQIEALQIAASIESITFGRFVREHDVLLEPYGSLIYPPCKKDAEWISEFERVHPLIRPPGDLTNRCFRFVLDKPALVLKTIDLELVVRRLRALHPGIYVVHTAEAVPEIIIRIWLRPSSLKQKDSASWIEDTLAELKDTSIRGVPGITRASVEMITCMKVDEAGAFVKDSRFAISTVGTNLPAVVLHSAVDALSVVSSSVGDTLRTLGIEAARDKIINETHRLMGSSAPHLSHLAIFADLMTVTGDFTSIQRAGVAKREGSNVLLRAAYGSPIQAFVGATFTNERNPVYGLAANQILGTMPRIGTAAAMLYVDGEFVRKNTRSVDDILDEL